MAKKFGKVDVTEDAVEPDTEAVLTPDVPAGAPPAKVTTGSRFGSSGDGGGHRPSRAATGPSFFARLSQFLHDTRAEMRRVSWPNATLVQNSTIITLVAVVFFAVYLFAVDRVWSFLLTHLKSWLGG